MEEIPRPRLPLDQVFTCGNCRYWKPWKSDRVGVCFVNPPTVIVNPDALPGSDARDPVYDPRPEPTLSWRPETAADDIMCQFGRRKDL